MSGIPALDIVIGLVFIYLLYSLLVTIIQEIIATNLGFRAKVLQKAIMRMLEEENKDSGLWARLVSWSELFWNPLKKGSFAEKFYHTPLIKFLGEDAWHKKPSYLDARNFSKAILDVIKELTSTTGTTKEQINNFLNPSIGQDTVGNDIVTSNVDFLVKKEKDETKGKDILIPTDTLKYLRSLWADAHEDVDRFKYLLEQWFDDTMARASGWYKRYTQLVLFIIGLSIAVSFNVDTIQIARKLSHDPELRKQLVQAADTYLKENKDLRVKIDSTQKRLKALNNTQGDSAAQAAALLDADSSAKALIKTNQELIGEAQQMIRTDLKNVNDLLGLGWKSCDKTKCGCCLPVPVGGWSFSLILGWLITALALSLGAPFWFDLLNKLMKVRGSLEKSNESNGTSSSGSSKTTTDSAGATLIERKG